MSGKLHPRYWPDWVRALLLMLFLILFCSASATLVMLWLDAKANP